MCKLGIHQHKTQIVKWSRWYKSLYFQMCVLFLMKYGSYFLICHLWTKFQYSYSHCMWTHKYNSLCSGINNCEVTNRQDYFIFKIYLWHSFSYTIFMIFLIQLAAQWLNGLRLNLLLCTLVSGWAEHSQVSQLE